MSDFSYSYEEVDLNLAALFITPQQPNPCCSVIFFLSVASRKSEERDMTRLLIAGYTIYQKANIC